MNHMKCIIIKELYKQSYKSRSEKSESKSSTLTVVRAERDVAIIMWCAGVDEIYMCVSPCQAIICMHVPVWEMGFMDGVVSFLGSDVFKLVLR